MAAFGRMIFLILAQYREDTCFDALEKPPIVQPDFLSGNEWNLLHVLWNADPTEEGCMSNAVERMKYLVKMEKIQNQQDRKINESWSESLSSFSVGGSVVDDIETYVISTADMTLTEALNEVGEALLEGDALVETDGLYIAYSDSRSVYNRVVDLKEQLFAYTRPLPAMLIDTYAMIVWDLYKILDSMNDDAHMERMRDFDPEKRIDVSTVVSTLKDGALNKVGDEAVPSEHDQSDPDVKRDEGNSNVDRTLWPSRINRWHRNNRLPHVLKMPDRLGDYMASLRNDFVVNNPVCDRGLDLSGQLSGYERETRVLLKLASTGRVVETLLRFGHVIESYVKVLGLEMTDEVRQWSEQLMRERRERLDLFSRILSDKQLFLEAMGNETQEMELMTLLKHGLTRYEEILMPEEMDIISEVYDRVVSYSEVVLVGEPPNWFLSSNDLVCDLEEFFYLDDVRKTSNGSAIANFCASRAAAQNVIIVHVEIDRLLVLAELHDASAEAQTPRAHMTLADVGKVLPTPLALLPIFETFMTGRSTGTRFAENSFGPIELALRIRRN
ncbi:hypothetical protein PC117_g1941 [Phytophthora cactorum]|uniref:Uncharacterized protein n=1 Tax=Phytophthora cactorum TaxID=29920 RepID=A0A8T1EJS0_9STRA|nr:hypothetical protein PC117_g1941 [Phytophthora cactorum]